MRVLRRRFDLHSYAQGTSAGRILVKVAFRDARIRPMLVLQPDHLQEPAEAWERSPPPAASHRDAGREREAPVDLAGQEPSGAGGRVTVTVIKAEGLLAKDKGGTSDPFAELVMGKQLKKTKVIDKTLNPVWDETFDFEMAPADKSLRVVLYDDDKGLFYGSSKEYLGSVELTIQDFSNRGTVEEWCV